MFVCSNSTLASSSLHYEMKTMKILWIISWEIHLSSISWRFHGFFMRYFHGYFMRIIPMKSVEWKFHENTHEMSTFHCSWNSFGTKIIPWKTHKNAMNMAAWYSWHFNGNENSWIHECFPAERNYPLPLKNQIVGPLVVLHLRT